MSKLKSITMSVGDVAEQLKYLRSTFNALDDSFQFFLKNLDGMRRPQSGDRVSGEFDKYLKPIRFYGEVLGCDNLGNVTVQFDKSDSIVYEAQKSEVDEFLHKQFKCHANYMDWDDDGEEWSVDLIILEPCDH